MEFQKIVNLLNTTSHDEDLPRFVTKKMDWNLWSTRKKLPDLCDYSDAYIAVKGTIAVTDADNANRNKSVAFKNNAPCINCISKINGSQIDNEEDIDVEMPMYNLLEYSKNYRKKKTSSMWNYYKKEPSNHLSSNSEFFKCKTGITRNTYNLGVGDAGCDANKVNKNETEVIISLKQFLENSNVPLINCEIELILTWSKQCVLPDRQQQIIRQLD